MAILNLSDYRHLIDLDTVFEKGNQSLTSSGENQLIDVLLIALIPLVNFVRIESLDLEDLEKRKLLRGALNAISPSILGVSHIALLDELLQSELLRKRITSLEMIPTRKTSCGTQLKLWKGDITTLEIDAIVNAANSALLGCFQPLHACIDNAIHSAAGMQLRNDCAKIMELQQGPEATGKAKITRAYNLPSKFVLHTVGPIVQGKVTSEHEKDLAQSYWNCLQLAAEMPQIKSVAFCCVSTGVFGYPPELAAKTAYATVLGWLKENPNRMDTIVFNVFGENDRKIYETIFQEK